MFVIICRSINPHKTTLNVTNCCQWCIFRRWHCSSKWFMNIRRTFRSKFWRRLKKSLSDGWPIYGNTHNIFVYITLRRISATTIQHPCAAVQKNLHLVVVYIIWLWSVRTQYQINSFLHKTKPVECARAIASFRPAYRIAIGIRKFADKRPHTELVRRT